MRLLPFLLLLCASSCATAYRSQHLDDRVESVLSRRGDEVRRERELRVRAPEAKAEVLVEPSVESEARLLRLEDALQLAVLHNRDYRTEVESLYLTAVALLGTRHAFSPQLTAVLGYLFSDATGFPSSGVASGRIGVTQVLPWGGNVGVDASSSFAGVPDATDSFGAGLSVRLTQPLLRGAGREVSHEALVQAERTMIYEVRDFELFREDFALEVASRFYGLVQSNKQILNQAENLERASFDRSKSEALFNVGRVTELEVLRAKRQELNSQNALLGARESYLLELDRFRIFLGLQESVVLEIADEPPSYVPVAYDLESAVQVALENRLDVLNRREQVEDAERAVRIARNGLLPDLDLTLSLGRNALAAATVSDLDLDLDQSDVSAGLSLEIPLDRVDESHAYRTAQISLERARRGYEVFVETLRSEIRSAIRELERREISVQITRELITGEEKNKRLAVLQYERGQIDNRELVDAEQSLLNARNDLIDEQVSYELARLRLLRDLGILFIDERGIWTE